MMTQHPANASFVPSTRSEWTFGRALAPADAEHFLSACWCKSFAVIKGFAGKYRDLTSWEEVEQLLELGFPPDRIKLVRNGTTINASRYLGFPRIAPDGVLNGQGLVNALSAGATLVIDSADRYLPNVRALVLDTERKLGANACANLYAGWRSQRGFPVHWDGQEALLLQIDGRKAWQVFEPTCIDPLKSVEPQPPPPTKAPAWEGVLEAGDALYLPRGWWHVASPFDDRTLHLTLTIEPPNGEDLLRWLSMRLLQNAEFRSNAPRHGDEPARQTYMDAIRIRLVKETSGDFLADFLRHWDSHAEVRSEVHLSDGQRKHPARIESSSMFKLTTVRRIGIGQGQEPSEVRVYAGDRRWACPSGLAPALALLDGYDFIPLSAMREALEDVQLEGRLQAFLALLSLEGVVAVSTPQSGVD